LEYVKNTGLPTIDCSKYGSEFTGTIGTCTNKCDDGSDYPATYKIQDYAEVQEDGAKTFLISSGTVLFVYDLYDSLLKYTTGIYDVQEGDRKIGLHASRIVGWGTDGTTEYWIASNSFSSNWGMSGYFYINT